jgi:hypothetical protein
VATKARRPIPNCLAKAHSAQQHQAQNGEVGQLAEDDEQEGKCLVGSARPVVDVVVEKHNLRDVEGIADPDDGERGEGEEAEDLLGAAGCLRDC